MDLGAVKQTTEYTRNFRLFPSLLLQLLASKFEALYTEPGFMMYWSNETVEVLISARNKSTLLMVTVW